jgi:outer membrane protein assembly factor BamB
VPRLLLRSILALVLSVGALLTGWRVLAPADVLATATTPYPAAPERPPGVTGRTNMAPLIVDGRIRVYGGKRQVRADAPVDARTVYTARWSFRRWPQQLSGVVAAGPTVVTRWSDGDLVALDARTGAIAWRAAGPSGPAFAGHRTGASTVWAPPGLHTTGGAVIVAGDELTSYDLSTGTRRWRTALPPGCSGGFTTAGGRYVCPTGAFDLASGAAVASWPPGPHTPLGCQAAASNCAGLRDGTGQGWIVTGPAPARSAPLDRPGSTVAAGQVLYPDGSELVAADPSGTELRRYPAAQLLGVSGGNLVLLRPDRRLRAVDPRTGATVADFPLAVDRERVTWSPGGWQVAGGFVAVERLADGGPADPEKPGHYFGTEPVIIAAL